MFNLLTTCLLCFLVKITLEQRCGQPAVSPLILEKIMYGKESRPHSIPYAVSIARKGGGHFCGGVLIDGRTVLTAAHCIVTTAKNMEVRIGVHDFTKDINARTRYNVTRTLKHERYNPSTTENDIAIIKLERNANESTQVAYICINRTVPIIQNEEALTCGWGQTETGFSSSKLMQVYVPISSSSKCSSVFGSIYKPLTQICAGDVLTGEDSCFGDSGGPLIKLLNNRWTLIGLVSYGDSSCAGYGVYTRVPRYFDWIMRNK